MSNPPLCPNCGSPISAGSPEQLCPKCVLLAGLESRVNIEPAHPALQMTVKSPVPGSGFVPPSPEELASKFPQLEILELLGRGGMGAVYKARQPGLDRMVAVKILPPEISQDPAFAERFTREARALAKLSHPHIVAVYDFGQTSDGLFYFVMEYVDGVNLRQAIHVGMPAQQALAIVPQICDALQFAHDEGIVHRDIKPENILLDKKGRVKIADFGLAKLVGAEIVDQSLTGTQQVMGTLKYMAPEQMAGAKAVDHRADIYSLGVVFYELLTGELPIGRFAPPSRHVQIDVRLDEIVLRALEREPDLRWQHASDVKTELEAVSTQSSRPSTLPPMPVPWTANDQQTQPMAEHPFQQGLPLRLVQFGIFVTLAIGVYFSPWNQCYRVNHGIMFKPQSGAFKSLSLSTDILQYTSLDVEPTPWRILIKVVDANDQVDQLQVELPGLRTFWTSKSKGLELNDRLANAGSLKAWLKQEAGVAVDKPEVDAEVEELYVLCHEWSSVAPGAWPQFETASRRLLKHYQLVVTFHSRLSHAGFFPAWALFGVLAIAAVALRFSLTSSRETSTASDPFIVAANWLTTIGVLLVTAPLLMVAVVLWLESSRPAGFAVHDAIPVLMASSIYSFFAGVFVFKGAHALRRKEPSSAPRTACILAMLPISPIVVIGLPVGLWVWKRLDSPDFQAILKQLPAEIPRTKLEDRPFYILGQLTGMLLRQKWFLLAGQIFFGFVYAMCMVTVFSVQASTSPELHRYTVGAPTPWLIDEVMPLRSQVTFQFFTWAYVPALIGMGALAVARALERRDRGKVHSMWWHYSLWIVFLVVSLGMLFVGRIGHATMKASQVPAKAVLK